MRRSLPPRTAKASPLKPLVPDYLDENDEFNERCTGSGSGSDGEEEAPPPRAPRAPRAPRPAGAGSSGKKKPKDRTAGPMRSRVEEDEDEIRAPPLSVPDSILRGAGKGRASYGSKRARRASSKAGEAGVSMPDNDDDIPPPAPPAFLPKLDPEEIARARIAMAAEDRLRAERIRGIVDYMFSCPEIVQHIFAFAPTLVRLNAIVRVSKTVRAAMSMPETADVWERCCRRHVLGTDAPSAADVQLYWPPFPPGLSRDGRRYHSMLRVAPWVSEKVAMDLRTTAPALEGGRTHSMSVVEEKIFADDDVDHHIEALDEVLQTDVNVQDRHRADSMIIAPMLPARGRWGGDGDANSDNTMHGAAPGYRLSLALTTVFGDIGIPDTRQYSTAYADAVPAVLAAADSDDDVQIVSVPPIEGPKRARPDWCYRTHRDVIRILHTTTPGTQQQAEALNSILTPKIHPRNPHTHHEYGLGSVSDYENVLGVKTRFLARMQAGFEGRYRQYYDDTRVHVFKLYPTAYAILMYGPTNTRNAAIVVRASDLAVLHEFKVSRGHRITHVAARPGCLWLTDPLRNQWVSYHGPRDDRALAPVRKAARAAPAFVAALTGNITAAAAAMDGLGLDPLADGCLNRGWTLVEYVIRYGMVEDLRDLFDRVFKFPALDYVDAVVVGAPRPRDPAVQERFRAALARLMVRIIEFGPMPMIEYALRELGTDMAIANEHTRLLTLWVRVALTRTADPGAIARIGRIPSALLIADSEGPLLDMLPAHPLDEDRVHALCMSVVEWNSIPLRDMRRTFKHSWRNPVKITRNDRRTGTSIVSKWIESGSANVTRRILASIASAGYDFNQRDGRFRTVLGDAAMAARDVQGIRFLDALLQLRNVGGGGAFVVNTRYTSARDIMMSQIEATRDGSWGPDDAEVNAMVRRILERLA